MTSNDTIPIQPVRFRGGGFSAAPRPLWSWLGILVILALWQMSGTLGWVSPVFLPPPASIVESLWRLAISGDLWIHLSASLGRIGGGWVIGTAFGLVVGVVMGLASFMRAL